MENQIKTVINLEMDIADFSGKTVKRIDIQNVVGRGDHSKSGIAVVMSFTDGATGTILVKAHDAQISAAQYSRPRMDGYSVEEEGAILTP